LNETERLFPKKSYFYSAMTNKKPNIVQQIWRFYINGFRNMSGWGRQVWLIIHIKLFIMFAILKGFFFPNFLKTNLETDQQRSDYVLEILTDRKNNYG